MPFLNRTPAGSKQRWNALCRQLYFRRAGAGISGRWAIMTLNSLIAKQPVSFVNIFLLRWTPYLFLSAPERRVASYELKRSSNGMHILYNVLYQACYSRNQCGCVRLNSPSTSLMHCASQSGFCCIARLITTPYVLTHFAHVYNACRVNGKWGLSVNLLVNLMHSLGFFLFFFHSKLTLPYWSNYKFQSVSIICLGDNRRYLKIAK